jgi:Protein of unknown function (DUF2652)/Polyketide cyclase / dehydrase and lipid transport
MKSSDTGYLLIADITGYTRFLTGSELDHARGILEGLFSALLKELKSPFALSNVQGDAILAHAHSDAVSEGHHVIDVIEALYCAFADALESMIRNTTCTCNACRNMANLDLKLFVHFGSYVEQSIAGRKELSGSDVILIHRLMKNTIIAATGIRAYAALTEQAVAAIRLPEFFEHVQTHVESSDDFGAISLRVLDMQPVWQRRKAERSVVVAETDRVFEDVSVDLPVPQDRAWHFLTHPDHRGDWVTNVVKMTRTGTAHGRTQVGSTDHCAHGDGSTLVFSIAEWRPPERVTYHLNLPLGAYWPYTIFIAPTGTGSHITVRTGMVVGPDKVRQFIVRMMTRRMAPKLRQNWIDWFARLTELAKRDAAARSAPPPPVSADHVLKAAVESRLATPSSA